MKPTLNFYGTAGDGVATLEIDRTGPVDLTPLFKDAFDYYKRRMVYRKCMIAQRDTAGSYALEVAANLGDSYELTNTKSTFKFKVDELFSMMLRRYSPSEFSAFLKTNMINPEDFGNETLLRRLDSSNEIYERFEFHYSGAHVFIQPLDKGVRPLDIERLIEPEQGLHRDIMMWYHHYNPKDRERVTTRLYPGNYMIRLEKLLQNLCKEKISLRVYNLNDLPKLDYFEIIHQYKLPTTHLKIVEKDTAIDKISSSTNQS